jgi:hypothetical protein
MYNAPSVAYPVGRCAFAKGLLGLLSLLTVAVLALWVWQQSVTWAWSFAFLLGLLFVGWGWRCVNFAGASLVWDGQVWCLLDRDGVSLQLGTPVCVALDLQHTLLLQWLPSSASPMAMSRWLWLSHSADPVNWQNLRRALYSRVFLS